VVVDYNEGPQAGSGRVPVDDNAPASKPASTTGQFNGQRAVSVARRHPGGSAQPPFNSDRRPVCSRPEGVSAGTAEVYGALDLGTKN